MSSAFIKIGEDQVSQNLLAEVEIVQQLNDHWSCRVTYRAVMDSRPAVEELQGEPLRASTFDLLGTETVMFTGVITEAVLKYEVWGSFSAQIVAHSASWLMDRSPRYKYFLKESPAAVASALCGPYGLSANGAIAGDANLSRVQWAESDYHFLLRLIDDAEAWLRPSDAGLETRTTFAAGPTLEWREGEYGLLELTTRGRLRALAAGGAHYDPNVMISSLYGGEADTSTTYAVLPELVEAAMSASSVPPTFMTGGSRAVTQADYLQRLKLESRRGGNSAVEIKGISRSPQVTAGDEVTISGLPDSDGTYGVTRCVHRWTNQGYENHFTATTARRWTQPERVPPPDVEGLYPARVVDNNDPHNQGRIRVQYFWQEENQTTWVRWLTPHAGPDRGFVFFPELGDEVLVGFYDGDPERPIAVGAAWSGAQAPPTEGFWQAGSNAAEAQGNEIKRLVTTSGHRVSLSDQAGKPAIAIATPRAARLLLTDADDETGTPSLALRTTGDIVLAAPNGRIHKRRQACDKTDREQQRVIRAAWLDTKREDWCYKRGAARRPA